MTHLKKALNIWLAAGNSQTEFVRITGIDQSLCSRIFTSSRGFTQSQREAVFTSFSKCDMQQGLIFLKADIEDHLPAPALEFLQLGIKLPVKLSDSIPKKTNRVEEARLKLISDLEAREPSVLSLALALHDWRQEL